MRLKYNGECVNTIHLGNYILILKNSLVKYGNVSSVSTTSSKNTLKVEWGKELFMNSERCPRCMTYPLCKVGISSLCVPWGGSDC